MSQQHSGTRDSHPFHYEKGVFVSYARVVEQEGIVNEIDQALQTCGIRMIRDLGYRASIREFMERMGKSNCVIVVISDEYLRSPDCMSELMEIADGKEFRDRIFPVVLDDANIYDPVKRIEYVRYWEAKRAELAEAMKTVDPANLQGIRDDMDLYDRIRDQISGLTSILKDMNTLTPEIHKEGNYRILVDAIARKLSKWPAWLPLPRGCCVQVVVWTFRVIGTILILGLLVTLSYTLIAYFSRTPTPPSPPACIGADDILIRLHVSKGPIRITTLAPSEKIGLEPDSTFNLRVEFQSVDDKALPALACSWENANMAKTDSATEGELLNTAGCNVDYRSGHTKIADSLSLFINQPSCPDLPSFAFFIVPK